jgi:hypothetical protein
MHQRDACQHIAGGSKRLEVQHGPGHALYRAMVLLDNVVEVFDLDSAYL